MSTTQTRTDNVAQADTGNVDLKLEATVIPVADVDRAKAFYARLGWRLDADFAFDNGFRVIQFTPPGSAASVQFGTKITTATPGSAQGLYLIVSDVAAARDALVARGVDVSEVFHPGQPGSQFQPADTSTRLSGPADGRASYSSFVTFNDPDGNGWLLQEITQRLPGRIDRAETTFASTPDLASALRRAEAAHGRHEQRTGAARRELAGLVRRVHGRGTGRCGTADLTPHRGSHAAHHRGQTGTATAIRVMHRPHGHEGSGLICESDHERVAVTTSAAMSDASISQHGAYELVAGDVLGATENDPSCRPAGALFVDHRCRRLWVLPSPSRIRLQAVSISSSVEKPKHTVTFARRFPRPTGRYQQERSAHVKGSTQRWSRCTGTHSTSGSSSSGACSASAPQRMA